MIELLGGFHYWYFLVEAKVTVHVQSRPTTPAETPRSSQVSLNVNELTESGLHSSRSKSHLYLPQFAALHRHYEPVGVLESQTYSDLEASFQDTLNEKPIHYEDMALLRNVTCSDLLKECVTGMDALRKWFTSVNSDRVYGRFFYRQERINDRREYTTRLEQAIESLHREIDLFHKDKRLKVLQPHLKRLQSKRDRRQPSYRLLFSCFFYQFHLIEFSTAPHELPAEPHEHGFRQPLPKWWIPYIIEISRWIINGGESTQNNGPHEDLARDLQNLEEILHTPNEEEPLIIQKRDPDAAPPTNIGHLIDRAIVKSWKLVMRTRYLFRH